MTVHLAIIDHDNRTDYEWEAGRSLAKDMLAFLKDKLALHGKTFQDLEGIVVYRGPGSFTGLRIGITVLNTLASSLRIPIVGEVGVDWERQGLERIRGGEDDAIVLPEYGSEALITKPRK